MDKEKKVLLAKESTKPSLKFGEYKTNKEENTMFAGANGFPVASLIPSSIGGTFSRVVSDNE